MCRAKTSVIGVWDVLYMLSVQTVARFDQRAGLCGCDNIADLKEMEDAWWPQSFVLASNEDMQHSPLGVDVVSGNLIRPRHLPMTSDLSRLVSAVFRWPETVLQPHKRVAVVNLIKSHSRNKTTNGVTTPFNTPISTFFFHETYGLVIGGASISSRGSTGPLTDLRLARNGAASK